MLIPSRFSLLGYTIEVQTVPADQWQHEDCSGFYVPEKCLIVLREYERPEVQAHTLFHEIVHAIFLALNRDDLSADERLVDTFAGLLHQVITSAEYDAPIRRKKAKHA